MQIKKTVEQIQNRPMKNGINSPLLFFHFTYNLQKHKNNTEIEYSNVSRL